jgi:hypothetical protein
MEAPWIEVGEASNIWRYSATHKGFGPVSAVAVELSPGRWAVISAPKDAEPEVIKPFEQGGELVAFIAPNIAHTSGLPQWRARWPDAVCYGPDDRLEELFRLTNTAFQPASTLKAAPGLTFISAPGTRSGSVWVKSERGPSMTVYLDEVLTTLSGRPRSFLSAFLYWLTGTGPGLSVNHLFMRALCSDAAAHAKAALAFADRAEALIPAHGEPIIGAAPVAEALELLAPYAPNSKD